MSLSHATLVLQQYVRDVRRSKIVRNVCLDCAESLCDRHTLRCCTCGESEVVFRNTRVFADGVAEWLCAGCLAKSEMQ